MSEQFYVLFDNIAWRPWSGLAVSTNVSTSHSPASMRYPHAIDGRRHTLWQVTSSHTSAVTLTFDRGAAQTIETDYGMGLGLFNHNLDTAGCTLIEVQSATSGGGPWTDVFEVDPSGDSDLDYIYQSDQLRGTPRYYRIVINFSGGGGPLADLTIGQLYFGKVLGLDGTEGPDGLMSPWTFGATIERPIGGGRVVRSRNYREQAWEMRFSAVNATIRAKLTAILNRQHGPKWPIGVHTHRHTSAAVTWEDRVNLNIVGAGGAYLMQIDAETISQSEPLEGVYDIDIPLVRHMGITEI